MSARRHRGSGTIRKLKGGYQVRYYEESGRQVPAPRLFRTKAEANLWLAERQSAQARGTWLDPRSGTALLADFGAAWLATKQYTPRSREEAERLWRIHIDPQLGRMPIGRVTPAVVRSWHMDLGARTGAATTRLAYNLLKAVLATAVQDGLLAKNPAQIKGASQSKSPERPLMTLDQAERIAAEIVEYLRPAVITAWWAHLRLGELLALRWGDVDFGAARIHVHRQIVHVGGELIETRPKASSDRFVSVPDVAVDVLREHRASLGSVLPSARVFGSADRPLTPHAVGQAWRRARARAGLEQFRFHDLRHGGLTLAAQSGATLYEVMGRAGHRTMNAAIGYQHRAEERGPVIAAAMAAYVAASVAR